MDIEARYGLLVPSNSWHQVPASQSTVKWVGEMINISLATVADLGLQGPAVQVTATNKETV